ncbi:hypothetical protein PEB0122_021450 [Bartonella apis]|uniref:Uncharacterized protein n=1 Tax=Bartonella apis TaxID=1686310 RepID=A0A1R0F6V2_9HYPH|nr:hypothetical protein PEB0149_000960 [Bartonella apis]OLY47301.1 hypothetical protein PEB0122_021450 [Bartonella apis]
MTAGLKSKVDDVHSVANGFISLPVIFEQFTTAENRNNCRSKLFNQNCFCKIAGKMMNFPLNATINSK